MRTASLEGADETIATLIAEAASRGEYVVSVNASVEEQVHDTLVTKGYDVEVGWSGTTISWAE